MQSMIRAAEVLEMSLSLFILPRCWSIWPGLQWLAQGFFTTALKVSCPCYHKSSQVLCGLGLELGALCFPVLSPTWWTTNVGVEWWNDLQQKSSGKVSCLFMGAGAKFGKQIGPKCIWLEPMVVMCLVILMGGNWSCTFNCYQVTDKCDCSEVFIFKSKGPNHLSPS